jgi:lysozyme family protein
MAYREGDAGFRRGAAVSFDQAFSTIAGVEKGFSDRDKQADPGGATKYGTTERVARAWGYQGDMRDLPLDTAKAIAKAAYWDKYQCDQFDPRIAYQVFDAAYNGGFPVKWLQECVGVPADGVLGAKTIAAVRAADVWKTVALFNAKRQLYMTDLHNWPENARGWARRIATNIIGAAA